MGEDRELAPQFFDLKHENLHILFSLAMASRDDATTMVSLQKCHRLSSTRADKFGISNLITTNFRFLQWKLFEPPTPEDDDDDSSEDEDDDLMSYDDNNTRYKQLKVYHKLKSEMFYQLSFDDKTSNSNRLKYCMMQVRTGVKAGLCEEFVVGILNTARCCLRMGDFKRAEFLVQWAIPFADELVESEICRAWVASVQGEMSCAGGHFHQGSDKLTDSCAYFFEAGEISHWTEMVCQVAFANAEIGNLTIAATMCAEALQFSHNLGNYYCTMSLLETIAILAIFEGDFPKILECHKTSQDLPVPPRSEKTSNTRLEKINVSLACYYMYYQHNVALAVITLRSFLDSLKVSERSERAFWKTSYEPASEASSKLSELVTTQTRIRATTNPFAPSSLGAVWQNANEQQYCVDRPHLPVPELQAAAGSFESGGGDR